MRTEKWIDPKYSVIVSAEESTPIPTIKICNRKGEPIPDDEPKIIFRARDRNALGMLRAYRDMCIADQCTPEHIEGITANIEAFDEFRRTHPERMKQPGITRGL